MRRTTAILGGLSAVLVTAGGLLLSSVDAQQAPPPAAQQAAPADPLVFNDDRLLVSFQVDEAFGTEFEVTMGRVKEVLAQSDKPERRQQAAHWKLMKVGPNNGVLTYFFLLDQVSKGLTYDPFKILAESGVPAEQVGELFRRSGPGSRDQRRAHPLLVDMQNRVASAIGHWGHQLIGPAGRGAPQYWTV